MFAKPTQIYPWLERKGTLSWLKLITFIALFLPAVWILYQWWNDDLFPKPITELIHQTGDWAVRILMISLVITPLRRIANWPKLILVRRMIGVAAMCYALAHFTLYIVDQKYNLLTVASEIALRIYLTIGFIALLGLITLGATSTDAMIKRIGGQRWNTLHRIVYGIGVLAVLHYFMQSKIDATQATIIGGFFLYLMLYRLMNRFRLPTNALTLAGLAIVATAATVAMEAAWYRFGTSAPWYRIMLANLTPDIVIRPAWYVLAGGLALVVLNFVRLRMPSAAPVRERQRVRAAG